MDLDAQLKSLLAFKKRVEDLIEGRAPDGGGPSDQLDRLRQELHELGEHVASIQRWRDEELLPILEGLAGLNDMANWLAANRAGLDRLLAAADKATLGGNPAPEGSTGSAGAGSSQADSGGPADPAASQRAS